MPDILLSPRMLGDTLDRQVYFDKALGVTGHFLFFLVCVNPLLYSAAS
jgi:hypothetical protein